jgi:uncharacterized membrane protein
MKFNATITVIALIFFSCNDGSKNEKAVSVTDTTKINDTIIVKDSLENSTVDDSLPLGAYQGIFPCKDCDGVQQTILFNTDKTFREEQMIWSKNETPKISEGNWQIKDGKIELIQNNKPVISFIKKRDTLLAVEINRILISNSSNYMLTKRNLAINNPVWEKKKLEGIDFAAIGNEPFWSLDIDFEKSISFKLADWKKPVITGIEKPISNKDSTIYKLKSDTTVWTITIYSQFCNDGMSDYLYQYKVNVKYNGILYKGCGVMLSKKNSQ